MTEDMGNSMLNFEEENKTLLSEASAITFQYRKDGGLNYARHSVRERMLHFVVKAIAIHGHKYGYKNVVYSGNSTKVEILCPKHGTFLQTPNNHLSGKGCPHCTGNAKGTTESFIMKARAVHGDTYNYDLVDYVNRTSTVTILCCIHGAFSQEASSHLMGHGCPYCYGNAKDTTESFIAKAIKVHGTRYNYDFVDYVNSASKVTIMCLDHGEFQQTPTSHLGGTGCPNCSGTAKDTNETFILKATKTHGNKYDYSKVAYVNAHTKITIICPEHGEFQQTSNNHLRGKGCPKCAGHNHDILYLLKCNDTGWYKIGITTNNTKKRMSDLGGNLEEMYHVKLEDPRKHESILHKRYAKDREYNLCVRDGRTEFFSLTEEQVHDVIHYMNEVSNER